MDVHTAALTLLSRRELSTAQLRERLARRQFTADAIEPVIQRLISDRILDDRRVALAFARSAVTLKGQGRRLVLQRLHHIGIRAEVAGDAVDEVFAELDEGQLLDRAIDKRLRGAALDTLAANDKARLVRHLVARGFDASAVLARLRHKGAEPGE